MDVPADLVRGYRRFRAERYAAEAERYRELASGQAPRTMVIACADSRVDPAVIFSAAPGELFVVRNVAALVPPFEETGTFHGTSAAIEFAVVNLQVERVVVLGHGMCGGVAAALAAGESQPVGRFIGPWVDLLAAPRDAVLAEAAGGGQVDRQRALEHRAVQQSLANLASFPFVRERVEKGRVAMHGGWFSIAEGELRWLDPASGSFERLPA